MNKKLMTLGVAAAIGLAGFAALPVLAKAAFEKQDSSEVTVTKKGDKYYGLVDKTNTGKISLDDTDLAFKTEELKDYINGKKFDGNIPEDSLKATKDEAKNNPVDRNVSGVKSLEITGKVAKVLEYLKAADAMKTNYENRKAAESVTSVKLKVNDDFTAGNLTDENYKTIADFVATFKNTNVVLDLKDKDLDLSALNKYAPAELKGKFTIETTGKVTIADEAAKAEILKNMKIKAGTFVVDGKISTLPENNETPNTNPENNNNNNNNNQQNNNNTAGNTQNRPNGAPAAPNTGIAE